MSDPIEKPEGSIIQEREELGGELTLFWKPRRTRLPRLGQGLFTLFWLGGWAFGEVAAIWVLILIFSGAGEGFSMAERIGVAIFLLGWLGAWTIGGLMAMASVWSLLRPLRPERVTLGRDTFNHRPGTLDPTAHSESRRHSGRHDADGDLSDQGTIGGRGSGRVAELTREQRADLVRARGGGRQRLRYDLGRERREIGRALSEPEREWLYDILLGWRDERGT